MSCNQTPPTPRCELPPSGQPNTEQAGVFRLSALSPGVIAPDPLGSGLSVNPVWSDLHIKEGALS